MKLFLDFDRTLYDLDAFHIAAKELFAARGIPQESYDVSKSVFATGSGQGGISYTPERHESECRKMFPAVQPFAHHIRELARNGKRFVFDDVAGFFRKTDGHERVILTFGDDDYQRHKISGAGLDAFVDTIIVTTGSKWDILEASARTGERAIFVDDHRKYFSVPDKCADVFGIHLVRKNGQGACFGCLADAHAKNLDEVFGKIGEFKA